MLTLDAKTGEQIYMERIHNHRHRSSPVYADGKIYCIARDGVVTILKAGREFKVIREIKMDEDISASPAISNGKIYIRSFQSLWCIGNSQVAGK
jgi:outer membrane protein assembly factor BamB